MRFVPVKSPEQQAALSMHRTRDQAAHCRHDLTCAPCKVQSREDRSTVSQSTRAKARAGRDRRDGKQDSTHHLGNHDTRRNLSCRPPAGTGGISQAMHE